MHKYDADCEPSLGLFDLVTSQETPQLMVSEVRLLV